MTTLTDQIRKAIRESGMTPYLIAKTTGISESTLSRFLSGGGMRVDTLDTLSGVLGLEITTPSSRNGKEKTKGKK